VSKEDIIIFCLISNQEIQSIPWLLSQTELLCNNI
jgi:hypothetical protein